MSENYEMDSLHCELETAQDTVVSLRAALAEARGLLRVRTDRAWGAEDALEECRKNLAEARAALLAVDDWPELDTDGALTECWGTGGLHSVWQREYAAAIKAARKAKP